MEVRGRPVSRRALSNAFQLHPFAPQFNDGSLWESKRPVYNNAAIKLTFFTTLSVMAACYLLVRLARPGFVMPEDSDILFELDWMPHHAELVRAFTDLYGKTSKPQMT